MRFRKTRCIWRRSTFSEGNAPTSIEAAPASMASNRSSRASATMTPNGTTSTARGALDARARSSKSGDEVLHPLCRIRHAGEIGSAVVTQQSALASQQPVTESADLAKWLLEVMGCDRSEFTERLVATGKLLRPGLQRCLALAERVFSRQLLGHIAGHDRRTGPASVGIPSGEALTLRLIGWPAFVSHRA